MCVHKKKSTTSPDKTKKNEPAATAGKGDGPKTAKELKNEDAAPGGGDAAQDKGKSDQNILAKPCKDADLKEKKKDPLHIKVPPPRVMKAKRPMKEVKEARDPEYKTIELDISEWESVKIMKRSDIKPEDIVKKEFKESAAQEKHDKEPVEAAA